MDSARCVHQTSKRRRKAPKVLEQSFRSRKGDKGKFVAVYVLRIIESHDTSTRTSSARENLDTIFRSWRNVTSPAKHTTHKPGATPQRKGYTHSSQSVQHPYENPLVRGETCRDWRHVNKKHVHTWTFSSMRSTAAVKAEKAQGRPQHEL